MTSKLGVSWQLMTVWVKGSVLVQDLSYAIQLLRFKASPTLLSSYLGWKASQGKKSVSQCRKASVLSDYLSLHCILGHCRKSIQGKIKNPCSAALMSPQPIYIQYFQTKVRDHMLWDQWTGDSASMTHMGKKYPRKWQILSKKISRNLKLLPDKISVPGNIRKRQNQRFMAVCNLNRAISTDRRIVKNWLFFASLLVIRACCAPLRNINQTQN